MDQIFITIIQKLVTEHGDSLLSEPRRVSAFLADLAQDVPKPQKNAFVKCLEHGFAQVLKNADETERDNCKQRLAGKLHEEEGLDLGLCGQTLDLLEKVLSGENNEVKGKSFCSNCGKALQEEWKTCPYCSTPVVSEEIASAVTEAEPPEAEPQEVPEPAPVIPPPKKKHTVRNVLIAVAAVVIGLFALLVAIAESPSPAQTTTSTSTSQQSFQALIDSGTRYYNNSDYDNAIKQFSEAIRLYPNNAQGYAWRGETYRLMDRLDEAIRDFDVAIRLDHNNAWNYFTSRGSVYAWKGNFDEAIRDLDEAIRLNPSNSWAFAYRGYAYWMKSQYDTAIRDLNEAIRLDPNHAWAYGVRGLVYTPLGQINQAVQDLEKALSLDPGLEWAQEQLKEIRRN